MTPKPRSRQAIASSFELAEASHSMKGQPKKALPGLPHFRLARMLKCTQTLKTLLRRSYLGCAKDCPEFPGKTKLLDDLDQCLKQVYILELGTEDTWDDLKKPKVLAALVRPDDVKVSSKKRKLTEPASASPLPGHSECDRDRASPSKDSASQDSDGLDKAGEATERKRLRKLELLSLRKDGKDHYGPWQKAVQAAADRLNMKPNYGCRKDSEMYKAAKTFLAWGHF